MPYKTRSLLHKNAFTIRLSGTYCYQKVQRRFQSSLHLEREPEKKVAEGGKKTVYCLFWPSVTYAWESPLKKKNTHKHT